VTLPVTVPDSEKPPWLAEMWHTVEPGPFLDAIWVIDCPWKVKVRSKARGWKTAVLLARGCAARPPGLASPRAAGVFEERRQRLPEGGDVRGRQIDLTRRPAEGEPDRLLGRAVTEVAFPA
jgi:hypothetical protein